MSLLCEFNNYIYVQDNNLKNLSHWFFITEIFPSELRIKDLGYILKISRIE